MDISFSEQDLQFQEEIRAGLNGSEYPAHVREKREKGIALTKQDQIDFHKFIHSKGLKVCVWTINDEKTFKYLIDLGVDGIITDKPKLLFEVLDSATNQ